VPLDRRRSPFLSHFQLMSMALGMNTGGGSGGKLCLLTRKYSLLLLGETSTLFQRLSP
jgi:hypothetical protein